MPKKEFAIERDGPKRLVAEWSGTWRGFKVAIDGAPVLAAADKQALERGVTAALPDGRELRAKLAKNNLELTIDRVPVPGSSTDPATQVKTVVILLYVLAGLNAALGLVGELGNVKFLLDLGFGWPVIAVGCVLGACALFVQSRHSSIALGIAIFLYIADVILAIVGAVNARQMAGIGGILVKILIIRALFAGLGALSDMRSAREGAQRR